VRVDGGDFRFEGTAFRDEAVHLGEEALAPRLDLRLLREERVAESELLESDFVTRIYLRAASPVRGLSGGVFKGLPPSARAEPRLGTGFN
jgi:hypothetical protein